MGDYNDAFMRNNQNAAAVQARTKAQNRANVIESKLIAQKHPTGLTPNLLKLFEPRPPLEYKPPLEKLKCLPYTGMAQYVSEFAEPGDPKYAPPVQKGETPAQKRARVHKLRLEEGAKKAAEDLEKYDPSNDPNISGDPYKTLFVARLNYETTESRIKREFEAYGPIKRVRTITDKVTNKPRGYAFIEYVHTRDMKAAYKQADGRKVDNRRVLVDVERGRTVPNWRPRRLGGGLGSTRIGGEEVNQKYSGREPQQVASGGPARSEEPRSKEVWDDREREKSRDRGRDRDHEREKSRERSYDRPRDRDSREERHHRERDRDRNRDRDRERDRGRDRDRTRDRDRDRGRDYDRDGDRDLERERDRGRERHRERDRDYGHEDLDQDRGRSRDREYEHVEPKREKDRRAKRGREYDHNEPEQYERDPGHAQGNQEPDEEHGQYDHYEPENYSYEQHEKERTRDREKEYQRSERSRSREYKY